ncbi:hypothetical protein BO71DRAFT_405732 [Aspergillus ellipticus CBS 707.79]|uniref:Uncharacterized protein n=1 Tax=Aspergillus ellipticus CBS 707.79 TaxID=1448320 RepID=A0A319EDX8_9EURO|nr:hypothetical protein BO71DRAFT_405732 [Aspergillus ellipticus CBS 707.79]
MARCLQIDTSLLLSLHVSGGRILGVRPWIGSTEPCRVQTSPISSLSLAHLGTYPRYGTIADYGKLMSLKGPGSLATRPGLGDKVQTRKRYTGRETQKLGIRARDPAANAHARTALGRSLHKQPWVADREIKRCTVVVAITGIGKD